LALAASPLRTDDPYAACVYIGVTDVRASNVLKEPLEATAARLARRVTKVRAMLQEPLAVAAVGRDGVALLCTTHHLLALRPDTEEEVGFVALERLTGVGLRGTDDSAALIFQSSGSEGFTVRFASLRAAQAVQQAIQARL
jgi:hypothetical protein